MNNKAVLMKQNPIIIPKKPQREGCLLMGPAIYMMPVGLFFQFGLKPEPKDSVFEQRHRGTAVGNEFQTLEKTLQKSKPWSPARHGILKAYFRVWE